jgi:hypothetical protein
MPKYALSTVLQKAIYPATQDRLAMIDADPSRDKETREEIAAIESLSGLKFSGMITEAQYLAAYMALTFAAQWEYGLAEAQGFKTSYGRKSIRLSNMFNRYRHEYFGKSKFETSMDRAETYTMCADGQFRSKDGKLMPTLSWPGAARI